ncbi:hypothetical protein RAZWK3B_16905 [Roseobacter sp. AzwK-3b]|nr:hypothetical protein RAZWK3B_16905 [Roseobacter sp. AzwK-3b]
MVVSILVVRVAAGLLPQLVNGSALQIFHAIRFGFG